MPKGPPCPKCGASGVYVDTFYDNAGRKIQEHSCICGWHPTQELPDNGFVDTLPVTAKVQERPPYDRSGKDVKSTSITVVWHRDSFTQPGAPEGISLKVNVLLTKIKKLWYVDLEYPPEYSAAMTRIDRGAFRRIVYTTLCDQVRHLDIGDPDNLRGSSVQGLRSAQKTWKQRGF